MAATNTHVSYMQGLSCYCCFVSRATFGRMIAVSLSQTCTYHTLDR